MTLRIENSAIIFTALLILGSVAATPCLADTIYSNLGPGSTWIVNREYNVNSDFMATSFVATGSGELGDIETPLFNLNNPVTLGLYTDSNNEPDTLLESFSFDAPGFPGILTTIPSVQNPMLAAGTEYWLVISVTDAQKDKLAWYQNNQGVAGGIWFGNALDGLIEAVPASPMPAIELDTVAAVAVPEPAGGIL